MRRRKTLLCLLFLMTFLLPVCGQMMEPVKFSTELKMVGSSEGEIVFTATIEPAWHVYSTDLGGDGPVSATFNAVKMDGVEAVGKLLPRGKVVEKYDEMFGMKVRYFENRAAFVQKIRFTKKEYAIECYLEYGACNDEMCLPPSTAVFSTKGVLQLKEDPAAKPPGTVGAEGTEGAEGAKPLGRERADGADTLVADSAVAVPGRPASSIEEGTDLWEPVIDELQTKNDSNSIAGRSLLYILLMGFVGGLLAVCMPCIWPIIPMTVSFFLKRAKTDKRKGIRDALTYGASIIVIYMGLGLLVTALFGSDTLNAMSTNAVFNVFLFLLLLVFALSFFGWFEIKLPDSWANKVDRKSDELSARAAANGHLSPFTSYLSIFLMAFTLVLVSFSCTAPIIGLLLVETIMGSNWLAPIMGMLGFALALALPFTLFALFPSWLKQAPKSGSWMNTIKVVLGFIELAFALKFLSVADMAYHWHLLDREVFLSLWIVIFALLGAYLCGWLKFQSDGTMVNGQWSMVNGPRPMPVVCIMGGLVSFAFAVYMVPGLWGAPCKAVSAFAPPISTQDFNLNTKVVEAQYTDYETAMAAARREGKPVLIDFTGFGCVNCRKMESDVWTDPRVADKLTNDFVLVSLYVDDKAPLAEPFETTDVQGNKEMVYTIGKKWCYLQSHKFGSNAQPFYVILDPVTGKPLSGSYSGKNDIDKFLEFLNFER